MPLGDPVLDYDGLTQYDSKLKQWLAGSISNLVHRTGNETIAGTKTFSSPISGTITGVTSAALKSGGGLVLENGKLVVDFSSMSPEYFAKILAALHLPIDLTGDPATKRVFYVDGSNGVDDTSDGRGRSADKPWQTIGYATQRVAQDYYFGAENAYIKIAAGTYNEQIPLGPTNTTGRVYLQPATAGDTVVISGTVSGATINHTGGKWQIQNMAIKVVSYEQSAANVYQYAARSTNTSEVLILENCPLEFEDNSLAPVSGTTGTFRIIMLQANGGNILFTNTSGDALSWSGAKTNAQVVWLAAPSGGTLRAGVGEFSVSGAFSTFLTVTGGTYTPDTSGARPTYTAVDSPTGKRYQATSGGKIITGLTDVTDVPTYFPGSTNGTVESGSYSFISPTAS